MSTTISRKHYSWLRALGITAVVCVFLLFTFIMVESSMDGDTSYAFTASVKDLFRPVYGHVEKEHDAIPVKGLALSAPEYQSSSRLFPGDSVQLKVYHQPSGADPEAYYFDFIDPDGNPIPEDERTATIDQNGLVTFTDISPSEGVRVRAYLVSNPEIYSNTCTLYSYGIKRPTEDTEFTFALIDSKGKVHGTEERPLTVGRKMYLTINKGSYRGSLFNITSSDDSIAQYKYGAITATGVGRATFTATLDLGDLQWEYTFDVVTKEKSPSGDESDDGIIFPETITGLTTIDIMAGDVVDISKCDLVFYPEGCAKSVETIPNVNDAAEVTGHGVIGRAEGTIEMQVVSVYDYNVSFTIIVNVHTPPVEEIYILTDSNVSIYDGARLKAYVGPKYADDEIIWEVTNGNGIIDENGKLQPKHVGPVVIRATSVADPDIYAEKTLDVGIFADFGSFVRKIMGHFSLFALLGFGFLGAYYFLAKRKYLAPLFAFLSGVGSALFSEFLQMFAEGRFSSMIDVMVDSTGATLGIGVGMALIGIVCGVWRALSYDSFHKLAVAYRSLNFMNLFRSEATLDMLFSADVYKREPAKNHPADSTPTPATPIPDDITTDDITTDLDE